jgi:hypothetical protein
MDTAHRVWNRLRQHRILFLLIALIVGFAVIRPIPKIIIDRETSKAKRGAVVVREFPLLKYERVVYPWIMYDTAFDEDRYYSLPHDRLRVAEGSSIAVYRGSDGLLLCIDQDCVFPIGFCLFDAQRVPTKCESNAAQTFSTWFESHLRPYWPIWW